MIRTIFAFIRRDFLNETSYKLSFALQVFSTLPLIVMFYFLSRIVDDTVNSPINPYGGAYFPFVLIGIAIQDYLGLSLRSFSTSIRESQLNGTLEAVLATPISIPAFLIGSTAYSFVVNATRVFVYFLVGVFGFGLRFDICRLPIAGLALGLTIMAFLSLGILSACFIILFKKGDPINWLFKSASWLLGGVYYPIDVMPEWMQTVAEVIPTTHTLEALRLSLLTQSNISEIAYHIVALGVWVGVALPFSLILFRFAMNYARKEGHLGHY